MLFEAKPAELPKGTDAASVGQRLGMVREALGLNSGDFATNAGLGASTYSQFESGRRRCSLDAAIALATAYSLTLDWIFLGEYSGLQSRLVSAISKIAVLRS